MWTNIAGQACKSPSDLWRVILRPEESSEEPSTVLFLGDIALAQGVGRAIERHGSAFPFSRVRDDYFGCDIVCFNLECCLSESGAPWEQKPILMRGLPNYLDVFPGSGRRYVANVANNHFLDYGPNGALDTLSALGARGMKYFGAIGSDVQRQPLVVETPNGTVGFLGFSYAAHPLPHEGRVNVASGSPWSLVNQVSEARKNVDILTVSLHQGVEYCSYTERRSRLLAYQLLDAGADCVVCHHTHVVQAIETYGHGVVFHGIGNFLIDVEPRRRPVAALNVAVRLRLSNRRLVAADVEPWTINDELTPVPLDGPARDELSAQFISMNKDLRSAAGRYKNDLAAAYAYSGDRALAALDTARRQGITAALKYYGKRAVAKLASRFD